MLKVTINQARNLGTARKIYCRLIILDQNGSPISGLEVIV